MLREDEPSELPGVVAVAGGAAARSVGPLSGTLRGAYSARTRPQSDGTHRDPACASRRNRAASYQTGANYQTGVNHLCRYASDSAILYEYTFSTRMLTPAWSSLAYSSLKSLYSKGIFVLIAGAKAPTCKAPIGEAKPPPASEAATAIAGDGADMKTVIVDDDSEIPLQQ